MAVMNFLSICRTVLCFFLSYFLLYTAGVRVYRQGRKKEKKKSLMETQVTACMFLAFHFVCKEATEYRWWWRHQRL